MFSTSRRGVPDTPSTAAAHYLGRAAGFPTSRHLPSSTEYNQRTIVGHRSYGTVLLMFLFSVFLINFTKTIGCHYDTYDASAGRGGVWPE